VISLFGNMNMFDHDPLAICTGQSVTADSPVATPKLLNHFDEVNIAGARGLFDYGGKIFMHGLYAIR
jgi:hypothetical protein